MNPGKPATAAYPESDTITLRSSSSQAGSPLNNESREKENTRPSAGGEMETAGQNDDPPNPPESARDGEKRAAISESPSSRLSSPPLPTVDEDDRNLVNWDGPGDPENPQNWSRWRKWYITMMASFLTFCITFSSSIFSQATQVTAEEFGVSPDVTTLGTSFVLLGFALAPLIWGPLSELYGRVRPLLVGFWISAIFQIPVAVGRNIQTILIGRFFIGAGGAATVSIVGGMLADIWDPITRALAGATFAASCFIGPIAGPIAGGFLTHSDLGWRWTAWLTLIVQAFFGVLSLFTLPETYGLLILQRRATRLRRETRNWELHAALDAHRPTMGEIVTKYFFRPIQLLILEPVLLLITIYAALTYGILYLFFFAYPISFQEVRGWQHPGVAALPFIGLLIGILSGCVLVGGTTVTAFARKLRSDGHVTPEERLPPMRIAAVSLAVGLFWFAWTSKPSIPWPAQAAAGVPIGLGIITIFLQGINYVIDVYPMYANSALAANTFVRGMAAFAFPLFAGRMYRRLGVAWATTLLACLTVLMIPIPFLFYVYGARIRGKSRFSPSG